MFSSQTRRVSCNRKASQTKFMGLSRTLRGLKRLCYLCSPSRKLQGEGSHDNNEQLHRSGRTGHRSLHRCVTGTPGGVAGAAEVAKDPGTEASTRRHISGLLMAKRDFHDFHRNFRLLTGNVGFPSISTSLKRLGWLWTRFPEWTAATSIS